MQTADQKLHTLLLPLHGFHLVLPQPTIAEIVPRPQVSPAAGSPDWLIGHFKWRAETVPLISFESMSGQAGGAAAKKHACAAVLYALGDFPNLPYYAIQLKAIPHPALLAPANLSAGPEPDTRNAVIAANVMIGGYRGVIPALEQIERLIRTHLTTTASVAD